MIFGGLEFIVGGYFIHRHYKHKNAKKRLEAETRQRRNNTFPGPKPQATYQPTQNQLAPIVPPQGAPQKYPYAPARAQTHPQPGPQVQPYYGHVEPRPGPLTHSQSFNIERRPVLPPRPPALPPRPQQHQQYPPQIILPLQRADSCATISRMPVANGYRPGGTNGNPPQLSPQPPVGSLSPIPQSPYSTSGFSVSSPALNTSPTTPQTPIYGTGLHGATQTIDDNWETYTSPHGRTDYAPSVSTALGERYDPDEPPPPYRP